MGILLKDAADTKSPHRIINAQEPIVLRRLFRGMLYHHKEILGFKVLRLKPNAADLARTEITRIQGQIAIPSAD
jgi:hypothetical protein